MVGAHALVEHQRRERPGAEVAEQLDQRGIGTIGIGPVVERHVGLLAGAVSLERRHEEGFPVPRNQRDTGALVTVRSHVQKPCHVRAGCEGDQIDAFGAHDLTQAEQSVGLV